MTVLDCKGHLLSGSELSVDGALDLLSLDAALACDDMPTVDMRAISAPWNRPEREKATSGEAAIAVIPTVFGGRCET